MGHPTAFRIHELFHQIDILSDSKIMTKKLLFEQLIEPLKDRMIRSIWRVVRDSHAVEDTLQNTLTILWKRLDRIRNHPNPEALILKICIDSSYDTLRRLYRIQKHEIPKDHEVLSIEADPTLHRGLEQGNLEKQVLRAIGTLSRKQSVAVLMRIIQEHSYETIAQVLGCSETTARIHVSRGRARLSNDLAHLNPLTSREREK
ncbi:RNA polymerase sigma factor [Acidobacteriota bacterium]